MIRKYLKFIFIPPAIMISSMSFAKDNMPVVTITDIGKPYSIIYGACSFAVIQDDLSKIFTLSNLYEDAWEHTANLAANKLAEKAKKAGGDAVVGLSLSLVGGTGRQGGGVGTLDGVMACGTIVKYKQLPAGN